ncbi:hypothetical protein EDC01DRAFT_630686 [Geopyxis carbonaria]|nr:hypothetical protein EDC01DRAFT_630686 [Geopyxis carbonaria]
MKTPTMRYREYLKLRRPKPVSERKLEQRFKRERKNADFDRKLEARLIRREERERHARGMDVSHIGLEIISNSTGIDIVPQTCQQSSDRNVSCSNAISDDTNDKNYAVEEMVKIIPAAVINPANVPTAPRVLADKRPSSLSVAIDDGSPEYAQEVMSIIKSEGIKVTSEVEDLSEAECIDSSRLIPIVLAQYDQHQEMEGPLMQCGAPQPLQKLLSGDYFDLKFIEISYRLPNDISGIFIHHVFSDSSKTTSVLCHIRKTSALWLAEVHHLTDQVLSAPHDQISQPEYESTASRTDWSVVRIERLAHWPEHMLC